MKLSAYLDEHPPKPGRSCEVLHFRQGAMQHVRRDLVIRKSL
jgi:hypothetical protein